MDTTFFNPNDALVDPVCAWCGGDDLHYDEGDRKVHLLTCRDCGGGTDNVDPYSRRPELIRTSEPEIDLLCELIAALREDAKH